MNKIIKHSARDTTYRLTGPGYLPHAEDELALRDAQLGRRRRYRPLRSVEIEALKHNGNSAADWGDVLVSERFNPKLVKGNRFCGLVRLGDLENLVLEFAGLKLPVGLYHSAIISCDVGHNAAIHHAAYLAHYLIGDEVIIHQVGQMLTTPRAKFGHGILGEGETEEQREWLKICNESGDRRILAFDGILPADAALWSKYRGEQELMSRLKAITDEQFSWPGGRYGTVGDRTLIAGCRAIIDVAIGSDACLEGAGRLENLTIRSDASEATRIGEGVELAGGIVGYGCRVDYGARAMNFVLGTRANLLYGARLVSTCLGDNSTVSCCEARHSLIFPNHEQHHNNSFLIAAALGGQSNIAAGATIGSNHNSRSVDGELLAGRGFWPGLCTSLKHSSRFAAYTLLAKGEYPYELDIRLPFSLVSENKHKDCLQILPAYWFLYNMYAVARNAWKFRARDRRVHQEQHLEFDYLAPDTVEEIFTGLELLEAWTGRAGGESSEEKQRSAGRGLLIGRPERVAALEVLAEGAENSARRARVLKAAPAYAIYQEMAHYYGVKTLLGFMEERGIEDPAALAGLLRGERQREWVNLGGQLVCGPDLRRLKERIVQGELTTWGAIHEEYDRLWEQYPLARARHGFATLLDLAGLTAEELTLERWRDFFQRAGATQRKIAELTYQSRAKDYANPFRRMTFDSAEEMNAVLGTIEDDAFIAQVRAETEAFEQKSSRIMGRVETAKEA